MYVGRVILIINNNELTTTTADAVAAMRMHYAHCSTSPREISDSRLCYARVKTILFIFYPVRLSLSRLFDSTNSNVYCHHVHNIIILL